MNFVEIDGEFIKFLSDADSHRFLGNSICTSATERVITEFRNRKRVTWVAFAKYKVVLLNHNVSLQLRLKYLFASIGPTILFGIQVMSMSKVQFHEIDRIQLKIMISMLDSVGGRRALERDNEAYESCSDVWTSLIFIVSFDT